jgi:hypothetical protein
MIHCRTYRVVVGETRHRSGCLLLFGMMMCNHRRFALAVALPPCCYDTWVNMNSRGRYSTVHAGLSLDDVLLSEFTAGAALIQSPTHRMDSA